VRPLVAVAVLAALVALAACVVPTADGRQVVCFQQLVRTRALLERRWVCVPHTASTTTPSTTTPSPQPPGRYRAEVFTNTVAHRVEVFSTPLANPRIEQPGAEPYRFALEFQRFEPSSDPTTTGRKAVVLLNGGGWVVGDDAGRAQQELAARTLTRAGWVAFTVEYPTYPHVFADAGSPDLVDKYRRHRRLGARHLGVPAPRARQRRQLGRRPRRGGARRLVGRRGDHHGDLG